MMIAGRIDMRPGPDDPKVIAEANKRQQAINDAYYAKMHPAPAAPAPAAAAPAAPMAPAPIAPTAQGAEKIVDPGKDSMAGLQAAAGDMGGGGGDMSAGAGDNIGGPSMFRQGIGSRIPPQYSASLAALRQVY